MFVTHLSRLIDKIGADPGTILAEDEASYEAYVLEKTMFELSRPQLENPALSGEALKEWQMGVHFDDYAGPVPLNCRECTDADLPAEQQDRGSTPTFRDAWEDTGTAVAVNMPKARIIHMDRIRRVRNAELEALDVPFIKALETGDTLEQQRIAGLKQVLRDIPQTFNLSRFRTPNTLKAAWPPDLPR